MNTSMLLYMVACTMNHRFLLIPLPYVHYGWFSVQIALETFVIKLIFTPVYLHNVRITLRMNLYTTNFLITCVCLFYSQQWGRVAILIDVKCKGCFWLAFMQVTEVPSKNLKYHLSLWSHIHIDSHVIFKQNQDLPST